MIDRAAMVAAIDRLTSAMERDFEELNRADGALGDGDLGVTMTRGMRAISDKAADLPEDLGAALLACAQAFTKSSGSSYGTLMATGLMAIAKDVKGRTEVDPAETSRLTGLARDAMMARGKADLGGKTVLDSLDAVAQATQGESDPDALADSAVKAAEDAMDRMRDKPATIGRARIFAEKSKGMDDPGMLAMTRIIKALANRD
ncbi:dihydroxyacetone kinase subunit L [Oceaniglobus indicus]|uniref:dihydroxyacetone kinase subunit L n=1 Tax=Oceaniglobus indicus TaxID=2047749 RepID=UPI000C1A1105|nr:dihydroxyacetone kinase subunit L [Oceaniglobus indicus]